MEKIFQGLKNYEQPRFGSTGWLMTQSGYCKISKLIDSDEDIKMALRDMLAMTNKDTNPLVK